jgi:predicted transcriptional regulator
MWEVRSQFSKPNAESTTGELEWSAVLVDTEAEAEGWWQCRTQGKSSARRVHTMFNPQGAVVRVCFD